MRGRSRSNQMTLEEGEARPVIDHGVVFAVSHGQQRFWTECKIENLDAFAIGHERIVGAVHDE